MASDPIPDIARFTIAYHGPALAGRSSNLRWLHARLDPATRSAWTVGDGADGPTLSFDVTPTTLPRVGGRVARFTLVTACGNLWSPATRAALLLRADGVVFVADSLPQRAEANVEAMETLSFAERERGCVVPTVLQYNKRDLADAAHVDALHRALNPRGIPVVPAVATAGVGVFDALRACASAVIAAARATPYR